MTINPEARIVAPSELISFTPEEMAAIDSAVLTERILDRQAKLYEVVGEILADRVAGAGDFLARFEHRSDPHGPYVSIVECKDCGDSAGVTQTTVAALYTAAIQHSLQCPALVEQAIADWSLFDEQLASGEAPGPTQTAVAGAVAGTVGARLWVNGTRPAPSHWTWARTADEAIRALSAGEVDEMSLDHDVAGDATARTVILWLTENPGRWPTEVLLHGSEPKRADWLLDAIKRYRPTTW